MPRNKGDNTTNNKISHASAKPHEAILSDARDNLSMQSLGLIDSGVDRILISCVYASVYTTSQRTTGTVKWNRANVEGPLYVVSRRNPPLYRLYILNQRQKDHFVQDIHAGWRIQQENKAFLFCRVTQPICDSFASTSIEIFFCIWMYDTKEVSALSEILNQLVRSSSRTEKLYYKIENPNQYQKECLNDPIQDAIFEINKDARKITRDMNKGVVDYSRISSEINFKNCISPDQQTNHSIDMTFPASCSGYDLLQLLNEVPIVPDLSTENPTVNTQDGSAAKHVSIDSKVYRKKVGMDANRAYYGTPQLQERQNCPIDPSAMKRSITIPFGDDIESCPKRDFEECNEMVIISKDSVRNLLHSQELLDLVWNRIRDGLPDISNEG